MFMYCNIIGDYTLSSIFRNTRWIFSHYYNWLFLGLISVTSWISPGYLDINVLSCFAIVLPVSWHRSITAHSCYPTVTVMFIQASLPTDSQLFSYSLWPSIHIIMQISLPVRSCCLFLPQPACQPELSESSVPSSCLTLIEAAMRRGAAQTCVHHCVATPWAVLASQ